MAEAIWFTKMSHVYYSYSSSVIIRCDTVASVVARFADIGNMLAGVGYVVVANISCVRAFPVLLGATVTRR